MDHAKLCLNAFIEKGIETARLSIYPGQDGDGARWGRRAGRVGMGVWPGGAGGGDEFRYVWLPKKLKNRGIDKW